MTEYQDVKSAEFFAENMAMLGFENESRALVMSVKEVVDNALDTCEDIGVLPNITLELRDDDERDGTIWLKIEDNGAGVPPDEISNVFGEILYGSRFGSWKQTRGQQGIGVSAVIMWSQQYDGRPIEVLSKRPSDDRATKIRFVTEKKGQNIDVLAQTETPWETRDHGTRLKIPLPANWKSHGKVVQYLKGTSLANPEAHITYIRNGDVELRLGRSSDETKTQPAEIKPHPNAASIDQLEVLLENTGSRKLTTFLQNEFIRMSSSRAEEVCNRAGLDPDISVTEGDTLSKQQKHDLVQAIDATDFMRPPDDPLSPLGEDLIRKTLDTYNPEFIGTNTRDVKEHNGHPYIIESGVAYGGDIEEEGRVEYHRVANRVPLVYDKGNCALGEGIESVDWERYELEQSSMGIPRGPAVIFVHIASTHVPFGNESKSYVSSIPELVRGTKLSLETCGREFSQFVKEQRRKKQHREKVETLGTIYEAMGAKLAQTLGKSQPDVYASLARASSTIIVDDRDDPTKVWNPTDDPQTVEIDGNTISLGAGDQATVHDDVDLSVSREPIYITENGLKQLSSD